MRVLSSHASSHETVQFIYMYRNTLARPVSALMLHPTTWVQILRSNTVRISGGISFTFCTTDRCTIANGFVMLMFRMSTMCERRSEQYSSSAHSMLSRVDHATRSSCISCVRFPPPEQRKARGGGRGSQSIFCYVKRWLLC